MQRVGGGAFRNTGVLQSPPVSAQRSSSSPGGRAVRRQANKKGLALGKKTRAHTHSHSHAPAEWPSLTVRSLTARYEACAWIIIPACTSCPVRASASPLHFGFYFRMSLDMRKRDEENPFPAPRSKIK
ncbi:hypothetical protein MHYP_G00116510 [Metynnis hypsauchen]